MGSGGADVEEVRVIVIDGDETDEPRDPGHLTAEEADASRAYRGCPLGMHEPGEPHHYTCWAEFL